VVEDVMDQIKLLIVDDERELATVMAKRLELCQVRSRVAFSGEEALRMIGEETPDVIVLDMCMPGISGMVVLERVRGRASTRAGDHPDRGSLGPDGEAGS
jgi:DNA-binding response OmpR family regulator